MKIVRLCVFLCTFSVLHSIQFQISQIPYLFVHEYIQLLEQSRFDVQNCSMQNQWRLQQMQKNFLWHLKIPTLQKLSYDIDPKNKKESKNVKVAILDTKPEVVFFNLKKNDDFAKKSSLLQKNKNISESIEGDQKNLSYAMKKEDFFLPSSKKNHAVYTCACIEQMTDNAQIIFIPILNHHGCTDKKTLCQGLRYALANNADIIHLGLSVQNLDIHKDVDRELISLLQQCRYVVVAAGNFALCTDKISDIVQHVFFSVGAFQPVDHTYKICDFSQFQCQKGPNFVMPGNDIIIPVFSKQFHDIVYIKVAGTSMAAALMTGCLAKLLSMQESSFLTVQQMQYIMQKNSIFLDEQQWNNKVTYGTINQQANIFCLKVLYQLRKVLTYKNINKNFEKIVDLIEENNNQNNFFVKRKNIYANNSAAKKIDSKLRLLVEHSINQIKELS